MHFECLFSCYIWLKTENDQFDPDLSTKVKFDITNEFFIFLTENIVFDVTSFQHPEINLKAVWDFTCRVEQQSPHHFGNSKLGGAFKSRQ